MIFTSEAEMIAVKMRFHVTRLNFEKKIFYALGEERENSAELI